MVTNEISPSRLQRWLEARLADVPPELAEAVRTRVRDSTLGGEEGLVTAALRGFDDVIEGVGRRSSALELLAADALLTYAFEAAADPSLGGSARQAVRLAVRVGPAGEIGARLAAAGQADP